MASVALDADVVIAFLDPGDAQHSAGVAVLAPHLGAGDQILLCATVYAEIMVCPIQRGSDATVDQFLASIGARLVDVDRQLARAAAELRARHRTIRLPDALTLATAKRAKARLLTLDRSLQRIAALEAAAT